MSYKEYNFKKMIRKNQRNFGKIKSSVEEAMRPLRAGMSVMVGGFGLCGIPVSLIDFICNERSIKDLTIISNTMGTEKEGPGKLL